MGTGVALPDSGDVILAMECGNLEVLRVSDGFGEWPWNPRAFGASVMERSRVGEEANVGFAEFGADVDLRSPSRYGEYIVLGERRASSGRKPAILAAWCICSWWYAEDGGQVRRFGVKVSCWVAAQ